MISIIIPIYNAAPYLTQCLQSLLNQSYTDWQAILVNDASTDDSPVIAQRFAQQDNRFRLITLPTNKGQSVARNTALQEAEGEIIAFLDADDYVDADWLQTAAHHIGDYDVLQFAPRPYRYTVPWSLFIRRSWLMEHHLRFPEGMIYEDVVFTASLWQAHPRMHVMDYRGYHYRRHAASTTAQPHSTSVLHHTLRQMGVRPWSFGCLRIRIAAHFAKHSYLLYVLLITLWST
ncbi:MAG: glycosyltransferase family 2 protein, partial [Paludibacteraceae bacterium]|nr:glycosyltransferase family 2 protein [Paludibacteraceae bacterium]